MAEDTAVEAVDKSAEGTVIVVRGIAAEAVGKSAEGIVVAVKATATAAVDMLVEETAAEAEGTVITVVGNAEAVSTEVEKTADEVLVMDKLGLQVGASPSKARQFQFVCHQDVRQNH